ncbi:chemotaxis protein CheW [Cerasicoccus maritimus]|uniref:chemotaxis protein CheW n=1 Tax=Cerasicoccus maritimus TaxID=490089 RepID=UPI002852803E|nr:chemotaxis protein CheW [Cerasicoccus maritimus]
MSTIEASVLSILAFEVRQHSFAVDASLVLETKTYASYTRLPGSGGSLIGLANYRNTVLPLINPRSVLLGEGSSDYKGETFIVLEVGDTRLGIGIDRLVGVFTPADPTRFAYPSNMQSKLLKETILLDSGATVALLDTQALLETITHDLNN